MAPPRDDTRSRRRRSALFGAAGLLVLVVAGVLLAGGSSDDGGATEPSAPAPTTAAKRTVNESIGASIARPDGWTARSSGRAIDLRDPPRATAISVSLAAGTDRSAAVLSAAVARLRRDYRDVRSGATDDRKVGGRPAVSTVVHAQDSAGRKVDILISAIQGDRRAWLVQVASGQDPRGGRGLVEAQTALGTLVLEG